MAQIEYTVNELIIEAFHLMGELGDGEKLDGQGFQRGFRCLNMLLDQFSGDAMYITLTKEVAFTLIPEQQDYVFSNVPGVDADITSNRIVQLEYCNITFDQINWPVRVVTRTQMYDNYYNNVVSSRPSYVLQRNEVDRTTLTFFNKPDQPYDCVIKGQFYLDSFEKFENIRNVPISLNRFFLYALARELTGYYPSSNWSDRMESEYQRMFDDLMNRNDIDMTARPSTILRNRYLNYYGLNQSIVGG